MQIEEDFTIEKALEYKPVFISDIIDNDAVRNHPSIQSLYQEALVAEKSKKVLPSEAEVRNKVRKQHSTW